MAKKAGARCLKRKNGRCVKRAKAPKACKSRRGSCSFKVCERTLRLHSAREAAFVRKAEAARAAFDRQGARVEAAFEPHNMGAAGKKCLPKCSIPKCHKVVQRATARAIKKGFSAFART